RDYTHSTAPNRRYPDLVTQRLVKALLAGAPPPYARAELEELARHCTRQEDAANRVERQVKKAASALLLSDHIGESFDARATGAPDAGRPPYRPAPRARRLLSCDPRRSHDEGRPSPRTGRARPRPRVRSPSGPDRPPACPGCPPPPRPGTRRARGRRARAEAVA